MMYRVYPDRTFKQKTILTVLFNANLVRYLPVIVQENKNRPNMKAKIAPTILIPVLQLLSLSLANIKPLFIKKIKFEY